MKHSLYTFLTLSLIFFSACDSDDSGPEDDAYQLFPAGFFSLGHQEQYTLNGTAANSGATFQGTHLELNEGNTVFDGQSAIAIRIQNDWTDENSNPFANGAFSYYSPDASNRKLLGSKDLFTQVETIFNNPGTIPVTAKIGESGVISMETNILNETITQVWSLEAASGGKANLVFETEVKDAFGTVLIFGNIVYQIDKDGNRESLTILFDVKALNDPVNWTGTKL